MSQAPGEAHIVATGTLTNIALLFAAYPDLVAHIGGLSIMGGAIGGGFTSAPMGTVDGEGERFGNWTPWAEFNIYCDPEAAQAVFPNPKLAEKTTLIPLDLTHQMLATREVQRSLLSGQGSKSDVAEGSSTPVRKLFNEILVFFAKTYADIFGLVEGPPLHDPLAVAIVYAPELFDDRDGERFEVSVIIDGEHGTNGIKRQTSQCGRTVARMLQTGEEGVRIPRTVQVDTLWRTIDTCLNRVESNF